MIDSITESRIKLLHPKVRDEVRALVNKANEQLTKHSQMRIVQGLRTIQEQEALYAQGRTLPGKKVTNAKGGQSYHNFGLAIDFALVIDNKTISWDLKKDWDGDKIADWMEVVSVFTKAGWEWGGTWKFQDNPHFEKRFSLTWQQMLNKHNKKDFIPGTNYINI
jgi:peptidoglycan L-alanyl-D-glutamate endopeptidase CwlK